MALQAAISPKRKAIADSSRTMFIWVAAMSAVVGICVVVGIFLAQQISFKLEVISQMNTTLTTLRNNNKVTPDLASNILVFESSEALNSVKTSADEKALQVILDALPADRNSLALGSSLQQNLLVGVDGLTVDSLSVDSATSATTTGDSEYTIPIQFQVTATSANAIKDMLTRLERSIRIIDIDSFTLEKSDTAYQATISAHAYYQPEKKIELSEKVVGGKG